PVEGDRPHIPRPHRPACGNYPLPIDPDAAGAGKRCGSSARSRHAGVPEPLVDALALSFGRGRVSVVPWHSLQAVPSRLPTSRTASSDPEHCRGVPSRLPDPWQTARERSLRARDVPAARNVRVARTEACAEGASVRCQVRAPLLELVRPPWAPGRAPPEWA